MSHSWDQSASVLAMIANVNRDPKKHGPFKVSHFHPFRKAAKSGTRITADNIGMLKTLAR